MSDSMKQIKAALVPAIESSEPIERANACNAALKIVMELERQLTEARKEITILRSSCRPVDVAFADAALKERQIAGGVAFITGPGGDEGTRQGLHPESPYAALKETA